MQTIIGAARVSYLSTRYVGRYALYLLSKLRFTTYDIRLDHAPTQHLANLCLAGDCKRVTEIIGNPNNGIDMRTFIDVLSRCKNTYREGIRNEAISLALKGRRTSVDAANRSFIQACEFRSSAIIPIFDEFLHILTSETIEAALIHCQEFSHNLCLDIINRWAARSRWFNKNNKLSPRSLAIGFKICSRREFRSITKVYDILNDHYAKLPGVTCGRGYSCECGRKRQLLIDCAEHGVMDMIRAMLIEEPTRAGRFLRDGVSGNNPEVVMFLFEHCRELITPGHVVNALDTALYLGNSFMIDMLANLFPNELTPAAYVKIFNENCEYNMHRSIELMLTKCRHALLFEVNFTFNPVKVKANKKIVRLLYAIYGNQLREQFPDWDYVD